MEDCRETVPPFFHFVKRYISTQAHDETLSFWGEDNKHKKDNYFFIIRSLSHHAKSLIREVLSSPVLTSDWTSPFSPSTP